MKLFRLLLLACLMYACASVPKFNYSTIHGSYNQEQIDSIYKAERLPQDGWVTFNFVDIESGDTAYNRTFYIDLTKHPQDSIVGIKYTHRRIDTTQYFIKQLIIDNNKRLKK